MSLKKCFLNSLFQLVLILFSTVLKGQDAQINLEYSQTVDQVIFHKPNINPDSWILIYSDPLPIDTFIIGQSTLDSIMIPSELISGINNTIAFDSIQKRPIGYVSGSTGKVSAILSANCSGFYVRGQGPNGYNLPWKMVTNNNGEIIYPETNISQPFPQDEVQFYDEFLIECMLGPKFRTTG